MLTKIVLAFLLVGLSLGEPPLSRLEIAKPRVDDFNYRLPEDVVPLRYKLLLAPDIVNNNYTGTVDIEIDVKKATKNIILHQRKLTMPNKDNIKVVGPAGNISVQSVTNASNVGLEDQEFFQIELAKDLEVDKKYIVTIPDFTGELNNDRQGFYLAKYTDSTGKERKFATTQFEPSAARRAFPCFDEPEMKATFAISIVRPTSYNSVSNMPLKESRDVPGDITKKMDIFEETVKMSTYLLAFIVSELELTNTTKVSRVLAKPEDILAGKATFAVSTGEAILADLGGWLGVPYSLSKMDQAAIPDIYFSAGAMENWGLVTYRETALLFSPLTTSTSQHQSIATIIAHEFAHQWFGNLVSPKWWEFIWLNEGFATYFQYLSASRVLPEWDIMEQFIIKVTQSAFGPDSLESTRPMNLDAGTPNEIAALFDTIAYEKSGAVIRMMETFLTTSVFQKGLKYYLRDRAHDVATPDHLYTSLQKAVDEANPKPNLENLNITAIMKTWTDASGYPVVDVKRNYGTETNNVVLEQKRFFLNNATSSNTWIIPVNFATKEKSDFTDTTAQVWLRTFNQTINITNLADSDWLIANKRQTGYYRVNYDETNWKLLADALIANHSTIDLLNRAQLIDDAFNLARSNNLPYSIPLQLSLYLEKERDYVPFASFFNAMHFLNSMISGTTEQKNVQDHTLKVLEAIYKELGFDEIVNEKHVTTLNRVSVLTWACNLGHSECRNKSLNKYVAWMDNKTIISLNLQTPILCGAMRIADQTQWNQLYTKYADPNTEAKLRIRMLSALGCSENVDILNGFLADSVDGKNSLTANTGFASVYNSGSTGVKVAFDYILNNFEKLKDKVNAVILEGIGSKLTTKEQLDKLEALAAKYPLQKQLFEGAIASAKKNSDWNESNLKGITSWFTTDTDTDGGSMLNMYSSILPIIFAYIICTVIA